MKAVKLLIIFLLYFSIVVYAQETESNPHVIVQIPPQNPIVGKPWHYTIFIDYPDPEEVTIAAPSFGYLSLERIVKSPRLIGDILQTVIDYQFIPNRAGYFTLESFMITCPSGVIATEPYTLNIRVENEERRPLVLQTVWEGVPSRLTAGERADISLRSGVTNSQQLPRGFFAPEVPAWLILSSLQLTEQEATSGILAKFNLIPLEGNINLPSRSLQFENTVYEIPALRITVTNNPAEQIIKIQNENAAGLSTDDDIGFLLSNITDENKKQRLIRLLYFYSILSFVIITIFVCLYLLLRKR